MAVNRYAVIEVAAQEITLRVYEISPKNGIRPVDIVRRNVPVGKDTFGKGRISAEILDEICTVLNGFTQIIASYKAVLIRAAAASSIREAKNSFVILDQIRVRTGYSLQVLSNSELRFLRLKAASSENSLYPVLEKGSLFLDMGAGSLQASIFEKKTLITTQNISLGTSRLDGVVSMSRADINSLERQIQELIDNDIQTFEKMFLKEREIKNILVGGDTLISYIRKCMEKKGITEAGREDFLTFYREMEEMKFEDYGRLYEIPVEYASNVFFSMMVIKAFLDASHAEKLLFPRSEVSDGIMLDYAESEKLIKKQHDFNEDILAASRTICKRYMGHKKHSASMEITVCRIFDCIRRYHGMGERERLLLQIAAILHDCGKFICMSQPGESSYHIIMATEILGLSHAEREIVANIARYNTIEFRNYDEFEGKLSAGQYAMVMKLAAILRLGNALDRSHKQKFEDMKLTLKDSVLSIVTPCQEDISLEKSVVEEKARFFEEVFGIHIQIRQKRVK